jgi:glycosyltransferase involved in cell wall biosynthesis
MRHVWILNHYAEPPNEPGGTRHYELARHLRAHGWAATLIASSVRHVDGRQRLRDGEAVGTESHDGVPFVWLRTTSYRGNGASRLRNMLEYAIASVRPSRLRDLPCPDLVIGSSVHPLAALAGWWLARRHRVPFLFEVRDLWPETLIAMGRLSPRSPVTRSMRALEAFLYRRASRIITLLPNAADYIELLGVPRERVVWISNGVNLSDYPDHAAHVGEGPLSVMYLGAHGEANGLEVLIRAMGQIRERTEAEGVEVPVRLRLIGDGPLKPSLQELAASLGLGPAWIAFEPPIPRSRTPEVAREADAFVITVRNLPHLYRYGISMNKLFEYMAAQRPVVIAVDAANNPVDAAGAGLTVPPEDPQRLADALWHLAALSPEERAQLGRAGRRNIEQHYGYDTLAARLAAVMNEARGEVPPRPAVRPSDTRRARARQAARVSANAESTMEEQRA